MEDKGDVGVEIGKPKPRPSRCLAQMSYSLR